MNKLPVGETTRFAYAFTIGQLGTIIGLIWLPMVAIAVLQFLPYGLGDANLVADQNPNALGAAALRGLVFWLASVLLYAMIGVAVTRQALGLRTGPALAHFALGRAEFRVWEASLLFVAIFLVLIFGLMLAVVVAGMVGQATGNKTMAAAIAAAVLVAGLCVLLVSLVRLGFLLVPVTVAEEKVSFERGWILTQGNFWRIAAVMFLVTLPTFVILCIASLALMGHEFDALAQVAPRIAPEAVLERYRMIVSAHASTLIGINLILAPFTLGLTLSASAAGYKALKAGAKVDGRAQVS
jgi:hypothetical protein